MEFIEFSHRPRLSSPIMLIALTGWPDAAEGATGALNYLVRKLPATKFASIDPEEFYVFTENRPVTRVNAWGEREISWPENSFYAYESANHEQDMLLFIGVEPNLKWRTFATLIADMAEHYQVSRVLMLGALLDSVPHTRPVRVTGGATDPGMAQKLGMSHVRSSGYQGPTGISSAVSRVIAARDIRFGTMWGHAPHYIQVAHFPKVSLALLESLQDVLGLSFDLGDLYSADTSFARQFHQALDREDELNAYVQRLERRYDAADTDDGAMPSPQEMVQELENYLRGHGGDEPV